MESQLDVYKRWEKHCLGLLERNSNYAPDLKQHGQKRLRAINWAVRRAAKEYMDRCNIGVEWQSDDIIKCQHRANHYGVAIGTVMGKKKQLSRDYDTLLARQMKAIRRLSRCQP